MIFDSGTCCISSVSYIKPQLLTILAAAIAGCISSVSYIKPQLSGDLRLRRYGCISSVSYIKPQRVTSLVGGAIVVYRPFPTSNHNVRMLSEIFKDVVYRPFPTSNHNGYRPSPTDDTLYIVRFLHQTTTADEARPEYDGCISSVSYIKPQL